MMRIQPESSENLLFCFGQSIRLDQCRGLAQMMCDGVLTDLLAHTPQVGGKLLNRLISRISILLECSKNNGLQFRRIYVEELRQWRRRFVDNLHQSRGS